MKIRHHLAAAAVALAAVTAVTAPARADQLEDMQSDIETLKAALQAQIDANANLNLQLAQLRQVVDTTGAASRLTSLESQVGGIRAKTDNISVAGGPTLIINASLAVNGDLNSRNMLTGRFTANSVQANENIYAAGTIRAGSGFLTP